MTEETKVTTRRGALGRMLGVVAGAVGVGALTRSKASAAPAQASSELVVYVPHMRQTKVGADAGYLPHGVVVDAHGKQLGSLHTASLDSTGGAIAIQTFDLAGGRIVGVGSKDTYVVVGASGHYAHVAGAYSERSAERLPGRQFTFRLREVTSGS